MVNHGKVRSAEAPEAVVVDEYSVWVAANVQEVTVPDEQGTRTEYEFDLTQYGKDEYIHSMINANAELENELNNTQLALCDVYELIMGGE